ncbi:hypothetical protein HDU81_007259 [Chytriomyces hyalinus]|nr:hypothetical protein HDU81_007259 [Chytriomyces hyalinus]
MTRKSDNKAGNATVAAVQQSHAASVQAAKAAPVKPATPQKTAAAPVKPAGVQSKPSTPSFTAKPATPQASKVQAAPARAAAAPQPAKAASPSAPVGRKLSQAPIYEMYMVPSLFSEPANWTANQAPCHAPHRAAPTRSAKPVLGKQNSAVSQPPPAPKAAANNKAAQKVAPKQAAGTKQKAAVKWTSAAGKQLILRPKGELVLYQSLFVQVQVWSVNKSKPVRGRSADKTSKHDRIQQHKQRIAAQRKPEVFTPKQQPNAQKPLSRQASGASSKPSTPAPVSRNQQKTKAAAPQKSSVSSPVDWQTNIWEDFYTSKHSTFQETAAKPSAKSKPTTPAPKSKPQTPAKTNAKGIKHASLKSTIPPPSEAKSPEIFSFVHSPTAGPMKPPSPIFVRKHPDGLGHPATFGRQDSSHSGKTSPPTIHAARLPKQNSNSSPTGNTPDIFASYMDRPASPSTKQAPPASQQRSAATAVPLSPSKQYAAMRATKAKPAPYMTASGMPREMANAWAEGSNYKNIQLVNDAEARGIQYGPQQQRGASNGKQKKQTKKQASWFSPGGFAVASAAVVLGGVGLGALMN